MPAAPIDLTPLLHGASVAQLRVAGVTLGEPASWVDRSTITGAQDKAPQERRIFANGTVYRIDTSGARQEVPLRERVDATLWGSGVLELGDVSVSVTEGVISRILVRGPSLGALELRQEADIEQKFGPAEGHERAYGIHHFRYPSRGLVFAWRLGNKRLGYVALGADP